MQALFGTPVSCGFLSPADEYIETLLDLNEHLVLRPSSTFFVRAKGDSMKDAGIVEGDLLIIDRSVQAVSGHIVLAILNGEFTLKRFIKKPDGLWLFAENTKYKPIQIDESMDFEVWGVALTCIHSLRGSK